MTQRQIEDGIGELCERLEDLTTDYAQALSEAAEAEASYRLGYYKSLLTTKANGIEQASNDDGQKPRRKATDTEAAAWATVDNEDGFRRYKITAAHAEALKQSLFVQRTRLDALRTLAANVRAQT